jgi:hypothetical protein
VDNGLVTGAIAEHQLGEKFCREERKVGEKGSREQNGAMGQGRQHEVSRVRPKPLLGAATPC